ncbi:unnamed protein product, partial [Vitis vinifera]
MAGRRVDRNATGTGRFKPIVSKPAFKSHHTSHLEDASFQPGLYTFLFSSLRVTQSHGPHSSFIYFFIYFFLNRPHVLYFVFIYILLSIYFSFPPHLTLLTLPPPQCCRSHRMPQDDVVFAAKGFVQPFYHSHSHDPRCHLSPNLHPGPVSLLHWSGKGKPWLRLDSKRPCPLDSLWAPYDLFRHASLISDS